MVEMVKCRVNGQWDIILPKHRADRPEWYTEKGWEKERLNSMHERIKKGDTVLYIGNEEGDMSGIIASWGANLILVEPNANVWPNTKVIWDANGLKMPEFCFVGFACNNDYYTFGHTREHYTIDSFPDCAYGDVISNHGFMELRNHNAPEIKIDTLTLKYVSGSIKHISIDVEGSEWEVLKGAEETIRHHKPNLWVSIHPEFMIQQYGQYSGDLRKWIKDFGYKETLLDYSHECHMLYEPL